MTDEKTIRLSQAARELNVGTSTITDTLASKGVLIENKPNAKITVSQLNMLAKEFEVPMEEINTSTKARSKYAGQDSENHGETENSIKEEKKEAISETPPVQPVQKEEEKPSVQKTEKIAENIPKQEDSKTDKEENFDSKTKLPGLKVVDKIDLDKPRKEAYKNTSGQIEKDKEKTETKAESKPEVKKEEEKKPEFKDEQKKESPKEIENKVEEKKIPPKVEKEPEKKQEAQKDRRPNQNTDTKKNEPKEASKNPYAGAGTKESLEPKNISPKAPLKKEDIKQEEPKNLSPETSEEGKDPESTLIKGEGKTLRGLKILGKIELPSDRPRKGGKPVASSDDRKKKRKRKKKRIEKPDGTSANTSTTTNTANTGTGNTPTNTGSRPRNTNTTGNSGSNNSNNNNTQNRTSQPSTNQPQSGGGSNSGSRTRGKGKAKAKGNNQNNEISNAEIQSQIKATLAKMSTRTRMGKKTTRSQRKDRGQSSDIEEEETNLLQVTEFISASDLASFMDVSINEVISTCMNIGMFVSINQRLDAEAITIIADEFNFDVEFISAVKEDSHDFEEVEEAQEDLKNRAPIVTIMGHVDHGKTSLLDYIRKANVTSQESGGITQHIGAYDVMTSKGERIVFLDTPGHEAFTAMRARGAKVTDIVILVVAADDDVMPQTKEALNHAQVAGVPIVIAINKIDKPTANPEKIKEGLAKENVLVESWGGKYQDQEISAKTGLGIEDLLEKVLLEAELLDLKANPDKNAAGTVIEASLDKGKGYVATVLVQSGTLQVGDVILAGSHYGRVKAMNDHLGRKVTKARPATPVQVLGLAGAPQSGDVFKVMNSEREAREIASKREQILREQNIRATRGLTLDEITRRRLLGNFQELKIIVKGDVDGSVEALADSLQQLSSKEIEIKIIHKAVGQISEADVMLASASEAIIVGFQVRPSPNARKAAEQEKVQIKLYSIIYTAIEEIRDAMEGMLAPTMVEEIVGNAEVRDVFKISKIGTVAGCYVTDGYIKRNNRVRLIRDGIVTFEGEIDALKRFKDDVGEVRNNFECGMSIKGFNDIKVGDVIENYEIKEVKRKL